MMVNVYRHSKGIIVFEDLKLWEDIILKDEPITNLQAKFASFFGPGITAEVGKLNALPKLSFSFSFFFLVIIPLFLKFS